MPSTMAGSIIEKAFAEATPAPGSRGCPGGGLFLLELARDHAKLMLNALQHRLDLRELVGDLLVAHQPRGGNGSRS